MNEAQVLGEKNFDEKKDFQKLIQLKVFQKIDLIKINKTCNQYNLAQEYLTLMFSKMCIECKVK